MENKLWILDDPWMHWVPVVTAIHGCINASI